MNNLLEKLVQNKTVLISVIVIFLVIIIILSLLFLPKKASKSNLSSQESSYPENLPQSFTQNDQKTNGLLVVTSTIDKVRVIIDPPEGEVSSGNPLPVNITPFKSSFIPSGKHSLMASKQGYDFKEINFEIMPNLITRINIELSVSTVIKPTPSPSSQEWVNKFPIQSDNYNLSYDKENKKIIATIKIKAQNTASEIQQEQDIANIINENLRSIGVDLTSTKIDWKIIQ